MEPNAIDPAALLPLLPPERVGVVERIEAIRQGLSSGGVYLVHASGGAYVLRLPSKLFKEDLFAQQLLILRRASAARVAPAIVYVNDAARVVVSEFVSGIALPAALSDPAQRVPAMRSLIDRLRALHAVDPSGIVERDPVSDTRSAREAVRDRAGFPAWAAPIERVLEPAAEALARDPRRVVSHNDVNPSNVLWDGTQTWLVDWEVAALGHPYYDLAALSLFLRLDDAVSVDLVTAHDGAPPSERDATTLHALRSLIALLAGFTMLGLVEDLSAWPAPTRDDAPTLRACYDGFRSGELDLQSERGRAHFALALLAEGFRHH